MKYHDIAAHLPEVGAQIITAAQHVDNLRAAAIRAQDEADAAAAELRERIAAIWTPTEYAAAYRAAELAQLPNMTTETLQIIYRQLDYNGFLTLEDDETTNRQLLIDNITRIRKAG